MSKQDYLRKVKMQQTHFVFNEDGSVYAIRLGYIVEKLIEQTEHIHKGDDEHAVAHVDGIMEFDPQTFVAVGPRLYTDHKEDFLKHAIELISPSKVEGYKYSEAVKHSFLIEWEDTFKESAQNELCQYTIATDRVEVAKMIWEYSVNNEHLYRIHRITESHEGKVCKVWEEKINDDLTPSLELIFSQ